MGTVGHGNKCLAQAYCFKSIISDSLGTRLGLLKRKREDTIQLESRVARETNSLFPEVEYNNHGMFSIAGLDTNEYPVSNAPGTISVLTADDI